MSRELVFSARRKDFRIEWFSGKGAGGQHRNKHQNCCRLIHIDSGLMATGQEHRERPRNLQSAFRRLVPRLVAHYVQQQDRERYSATETVRTYHEPNNRVKDHESGLVRSYSEIVGKKDLSEMIEARRKATLNRRASGEQETGPY